MQNGFGKIFKLVKVFCGNLVAKMLIGISTINYEIMKRRNISQIICEILSRGEICVANFIPPCDWCKSASLGSYFVKYWPYFVCKHRSCWCEFMVMQFQCFADTMSTSKRDVHLSLFPSEGRVFSLSKIVEFAWLWEESR